MANAADLTGTLDRLEERVANHITFFRLAVGAGVVWLGAISVTLFTMNGTLNRLGQLQANSPARTAQALLKSPIKSKDEAAGNLAAVAAVLRSAPSRNTTKPDPTVLNSVSADIVTAQVQYPDLPET